ncbi:MAG: dTMP kinase [Chloroflexota bacterium]|nr:MAG: dTMP kinase [Chloroflexota bacterium]
MFVTFEGSEGSGKSTQIALLADYLRGKGYRVATTREPGGTLIGEQVRGCLHDVANREMTAAAEVLLYSASRAQLVEEVIRPALQESYVVLSDRYADSTLAYQGYGRLLNLDTLATITQLATGGLKPDLSLFLDVDVEEGLTRRSEGGEEMNRMDLQTLAFYQRVREGYLSMIAAEPDRWVIVDASRAVEAIQEDVRRHVESRLTAHTGK